MAKLSTVEVASFTENWQRFLPENLGDLFFFYDLEKKETQRIVTYELDSNDLEDLKTVLKSGDRIRILMASEGSAKPDQVPTQPLFSPILEVLKGDGSDNTYFSMSAKGGTYVGDGRVIIANGGEIPESVAYLFVVGWIETAISEVTNQFIGISNNQLDRVKAYTYQAKETDMIIASLATASAFYMHLGTSIKITDHPFAFRPVLHTVSAVVTADGDDDDDYFDFSNPCPPKCS